MTPTATVATPGTSAAHYGDLPQIFVRDNTYAPEQLYVFRGGKYRFEPSDEVRRDVRCYVESVDDLRIATYLVYVTLSLKYLRNLKTCEFDSVQDLNRAILELIILRKLMTTNEPPETEVSDA